MINKLSIVIMAHPSRAHLIPYLKEKLGDVPVIFDTKNNLWDTCRRAWLAHDMSCEYGVVIQDDALVTENFREKAERVLTGNFLYSFYLSSFLVSRVNIAKKRGIDHVRSAMIFNEVALCMKTKDIKKMVKFCDDRGAQNDHEIGRWAKSLLKQICYPIPSLVSHRDDIESIYKKVVGQPQPTRERKALEFYEK